MNKLSNQSPKWQEVRDLPEEPSSTGSASSPGGGICHSLQAAIVALFLQRAVSSSPIVVWRPAAGDVRQEFPALPLPSCPQHLISQAHTENSRRESAEVQTVPQKQCGGIYSRRGFYVPEFEKSCSCLIFWSVLGLEPALSPGGSTGAGKGSLPLLENSRRESAFSGCVTEPL